MPTHKYKKIFFRGKSFVDWHYVFRDFSHTNTFNIHVHSIVFSKEKRCCAITVFKTKKKISITYQTKNKTVDLCMLLCFYELHRNFISISLFLLFFFILRATFFLSHSRFLCEQNSLCFETFCTEKDFLLCCWKYSGLFSVNFRLKIPSVFMPII